MVVFIDRTHEYIESLPDLFRGEACYQSLHAAKRCRGNEVQYAETHFSVKRRL